MIDFARVDSRQFDMLDPVVEALVNEAAVDPDKILVVGANCRDLLHAALGHKSMMRATMDADLGVAVNDWDVVRRIECTFMPNGATGIRYRIAGIAVDIIPFGGVEDPEGISRPEKRKEDIVVFGFQDVYKKAMHLKLPSGKVVRIPKPAGYAALKMRAWIDRSEDGAGDKDAHDLALSAHWYQQDPEVLDWLYDQEGGYGVLEEVGYDVYLGAIRRLALDVMGQLSPDNQQDLRRRWERVDLDKLAMYFDPSPSIPWPNDFRGRRKYVAELQF